MKSSTTAITCAMALVAATLLAACGSPEKAPAKSTAQTAASAQKIPAEAAATAEPPAGRTLPAPCTLLPPAELQQLTGLEAKRWKRDLLDAEHPLLDTCAWRLDGDKPIILSLNVRSNPNAKRRTGWSAKILQKLLAQGRTDKKGTKFQYLPVPGLGDLAAWSQEDGQIRWSEDNQFLFTLHTQKADLLTRDQFVALAQAASKKVHN